MNRINLNKIKLILIPIFLFAARLSAAEGIEIRFLDGNSKPIPFVSVRFMDGKTAVSNADGSLSVTKEVRSFTAFATGYQLKSVSLGEAAGDVVTIYLTQLTADLSEVVVTGLVGPQSAKLAVYQVRTIDKGVIQRRAAGNIQEVLNTELGIRFSQDNALGSGNLEMLGMSGQNVKILIDGVPMVGRQGVSNEININQIDINTIEKIEIIEGPMAVVYGADALAGVINIITKNPKKNAGISAGARLQEETVGNSYQPFWGKGNHIRSLNAGYNSSKNWHVAGSFTQNRFGGWKGDFTDRRYQWLPKNQDLLNLQGGVSFGSLDLDYALDNLSETVFSFGPENRLENIDQEFVTSRWMHRLNGNWNWKPAVKLSFQAAYTDYARLTETWVTNVRTGERNLSVAPGSQPRIDYQGLTLRGMAFWTLSPRLNLQPGIDINTETGSGERISDNEGIRDYAGFLVAEWSPRPAIKIRPGIRAAYNSAYAPPPFIPSLNTKWMVSKDVDFRFAYARGFRAPSIRELYFDFFDASHSIMGNPNLRAETSHSFNGSLNWVKKNLADGYEANLSGFYNQIDDKIAYGIYPEDPRITTLFNIEEFRTAGVMLNQSIRHKTLSLNLGLARIGRFNLFSAESADIPEMLFSTDVNATLSYLIPWIKTDLSVFYKWTGALPGFEMSTDGGGNAAPRPIVLDGFHWMDVTLKRSIAKNLSANIGVRNALDVTNIESTTGGGGAHGGGPMRPIGYGRSWFVSLNYQLSK
jgi:outer membrane receptor for ferrienterochelin and colicins